MDLEYLKIEPSSLRDLGLDERWLQDRIEDDPSIIGLGDLVLIERERSQPAGGRIDFLMYDPDDSGVRYEIEVMLGRVDESHIIRTIEYWDVERQRYPNMQHRAVLIAEDLTTRFLNVISLLNRSIPMIAIQIASFKIDSRVVVLFTKLLDLSVESTSEQEDGPSEEVNAQYWQRKASADSLGATEKLMTLIPGQIKPTYNRSHIAIGTTGRHFCWIHPRKGSHVVMHVRAVEEERDAWLARLESAGLPVAAHRRGSNIKLTRLVQRDIGEHEALLRELLEHCEAESRRR